MSSCILHQNPCATITLLDIPRSIELAEGASPSERLLSSKALEHPYPSVEPKSVKARTNLGHTSLQDLLLQRHLQLALDELQGDYEGPWCLPRVLGLNLMDEVVTTGKKRRRCVMVEGEKDLEVVMQRDHVLSSNLNIIHYNNPNETSLYASLGPNKLKARIPPNSTVLQGDISTTLDIFTRSAPTFNLIVLDPPWPNRSARRKQSYSISYGTSEIYSLLSSLPIYDHLADEGLVTVWVTNKASFRELILEEGGLFDQWGVRLVEEWIWLKVTSSGEPICALGSTWRKPFEVLLVGRRGAEIGEGTEVKRRVIVGVPDLHSRKPNLKVLFESLFGKQEREFEALEIFARNPTAEWWSWGNEVLKFLIEEHWTEA
jgi:N6-adenosine-specific RNA methylase IME4